MVEKLKNYPQGSKKNTTFTRPTNGPITMSTALYPLVPPFVAVVILIARLLIDFGYKFGLVDQPNSRSSHVGAVPRVGGISIFIPYILLGLGLYFANFDFVVNNAPYWIGLTAIVVLGTIDDRLNLSSKFKFSIQFAVAAYYVLSSGNYVDNMYGLFGIGVLPSWLGITLSIITVVYLINAINLIDGVDGLCGRNLNVEFVFVKHTHGRRGVLLFIRFLGLGLIVFMGFNFSEKKKNLLG